MTSSRVFDTWESRRVDEAHRDLCLRRDNARVAWQRSSAKQTQAIDAQYAAWRAFYALDQEVQRREHRAPPRPSWTQASPGGSV